MLLVFLRHGSVAALVVAVAAEALAFLFGWVSIKPALILLGALLFYLSEYGMHRFAFHAPPLSWPLARRLQHRLHPEATMSEPGRLDLLFLPDLVSAARSRRCHRAVGTDLWRGRFRLRVVRDDARHPAL